MLYERATALCTHYTDFMAHDKCTKHQVCIEGSEERSHDKSTLGTYPGNHSALTAVLWPHTRGNGIRDTSKPGLWTLDWTVDWTVDSVCDNHYQSIGTIIGLGTRLIIYGLPAYCVTGRYTSVESRVDIEPLLQIIISSWISIACQHVSLLWCQALNQSPACCMYSSELHWAATKAMLSLSGPDGMTLYDRSQ